MLHEDNRCDGICPACSSVFFWGCEARKVVADLTAEPLLTHGCSVAVVLFSWALYPNVFKHVQTVLPVMQGNEALGEVVNC